MFVCTHTHTHIVAYTYTYTYNLSIYIYTHTYLYTYIHIMYVCVYTYIAGILRVFGWLQAVAEGLQFVAPDAHIYDEVGEYDPVFVFLYIYGLVAHVYGIHKACI